LIRIPTDIHSSDAHSHAKPQQGGTRAGENLLMKSYILLQSMVPESTSYFTANLVESNGNLISPSPQIVHFSLQLPFKPTKIQPLLISFV
jgi:hypothetical protein